MTDFLSILELWLGKISDWVWGPPLLILLIGTHIFLTVRLRFIQRYLWRAIKISLSRNKEGEGDISQFGALTTALAATIGTGNIVGVATAVAAGVMGSHSEGMSGRVRHSRRVQTDLPGIAGGLPRPFSGVENQSGGSRGGAGGGT